MSISVVNNLELCYRGTVRHGRGGGGSVIAAFFLAHNYLSEQFGNYVEYGNIFFRYPVNWNMTGGALNSDICTLRLCICMILSTIK